MQLGRHEQALAALTKAAKLKPEDAAIAHNTGRSLEALGRAEEAERAYDLALSIDHRLLPALSARAELLAARGEWAGALADLETALVSQPNDPRLRLRRGEPVLAPSWDLLHSVVCRPSAQQANHIDSANYPEWKRQCSRDFSP